MGKTPAMDTYDVIDHCVRDGKEYEVMCYPNILLQEAEVLADELRKIKAKYGRKGDVKIVISFGDC